MKKDSMKRLLILLALVAVLLPLRTTIRSQGVTWFVSTAGSDANSCAQAQSISTPKLTITSALACVGSAGTDTGAGDTVQVAAGTYSESLEDKIPSGTVGNVFTLTCITDLACTVTRSGSQAWTGFNTASHYITVRGFVVDGGGGSYLSAAVADTHHHISFINNEWKNMPSGMGLQASGSSDITVSGNLIHDMGSVCNGFLGLCHGIYPSAFTEDWIIENNTVYNVAAYGIHLYDATNPPTGFIIRRNITHSNGTAGNNGAGIIAYGSGHQINTNISYSNAFEGILLRGISSTTIAYNTIYANCLVGCGGAAGGISVESGAATCTDNLAIENGGLTNPINCTDGSNNVTTGGAAGNFVNAGAGNFHLISTSPAINAGVAIPGITTDFDNVARGNPPDVGAYEFDSPIPPPPPVITGMSPNQGTISYAIPVTVSGTNNTWTSGSTVMSFSGSGVTAGATTCSTANSCTATITLSPSAATGFRNLTMTTGATITTLSNAFNVQQASEYVSTSCTATDIQNKMTASTNTGSGTGVFLDCTGITFTTVPAGECLMEFVAPANSYIRGRGNTTTVGGGNLTILTDSISRSGGDKWSFCISQSSTGVFDWRGITLRGTTANTNGMVRFSEASNGSGAQFRLHHSTIEPTSGVGILFSGQLYGVADHNVFNLTTSTAMKYWAARWGGGSNFFGDGAWADDTNLGTNKFIYAEDNTFVSNLSGAAAASIVEESYLGSRFVLRFNTMTNGPPTRTFPTGGSGRDRGARAFEIYGNNFNALDDAHNTRVFFLSSGAGVVWGNAAPLGFDNFITLHSLRRNNTTYTQTATPNGWGYCGTSFNGTGSNWDGNTPSAVTGYPCLDAPGRGKGDLLSGTFPSVTNVALGCTSSTPCWPRQALEPLYEWNNTFVSDSTGSTATVTNDGNFTANTDYYSPSSVTCVSGGACTAGIGSGTTLPTTCTTGVGFWKTNEGAWRTALPSTGYTGQGVLYKCTSTNTWSSFYTPYIYPHNLVGGGGGILSISPTTGAQGTSAAITISGTNTGWINGTTVASFSGSGITVNSTACTSTTACTANIDIVGNATVGLRNLTMTTGAATAVLPNAFNVTASVCTAAKLGFIQQPPTQISSAAVMTPSVTIAIQCANGSTVTSSTASVVVALGAGSPAGTLGGTLTRAAVAGIATFNNLTVTSTDGGNGYTLTATSTGLTGATSNAFRVLGNTPGPTPPTGVCVTLPLNVTVSQWPAQQTGSRQLRWNSGNFRITNFVFTSPNSVTFTDSRGCTRTVLR